jgi:serine-type D-Ala-D-Ala carboxypeptidase/endopeptidase
VTEHSIFEIGSITKTFTGILLADRVIRGESTLNDPLQNYLPEGITAPTRSGTLITLAHLSNHTSGLPYMPGNLKPSNPANPFADYSEQLLYDFLKSYVLPRDIGSKYEYSNYAAGLLGHVLAVKSKMSYEQLMIAKIAEPLKLENTRITLTPAMKKNLATGYVGEVETGIWDLTALAGAGAIRSSGVDMIRYVSANMGLFKTSLYPAIQLSHQNSRVEGAVPKVGLGWHIIPIGNKEIIWHNGGTGGYRTFIGFIKGENKGVVVLSNSNQSIDDIGFHLLNPEAPLKVIEKSVTVDAAVLERYTGKYELAPGFILTVSRTDNQLKAQLTGQPEFPIFPKSENVFFYRVVEAQLTFNKNSDGAVESVLLEQAGQKIPGKKLK